MLYSFLAFIADAQLAWLLYFYMSKIQNVMCVKIYENTIPIPSPTIFHQFEPDVLKKSCLLKPQHGPCRSDIRMYYYNPALKNCTTFDWGGCQGNGNRYDTYEDCMGYCLSTQDTTKTRPHWCALTFDYGYCFGSVVRYYFDNLWKVCKTTLYSGCGGNRNNFYTLAQCESVCLYGNGPIQLEDKSLIMTFKKQLIINPTTSSTILRASSTDPTTSMQ